MSNPQLNSADSSAVVATIRESSTMSPWTYNEKNRLVSPHSMNLLNVPVSSGTVAASKTFSFDVPKQGLAQGFYLNLSMPALNITDAETVDNNINSTVGGSLSLDTTQTQGFLAMGILQCIREIRLETSGRVLEQMSKWQMLARYSDLPAGKKRAVQQALRMAQDPDDNAAYKCVVWLPFFGFREPERYAYNSSFCEPLRLIVTLDDCNIHHTSTATPTYAIGAHAPTDAELMVHYRQLAAADEDSLISANYSDGLLSRILSISREEAVHTFNSHASATTTSTTVELKENDCISAIYVMVECPAITATTYAATLKAQGVPLEVTNIALKFNNMDVLNCPGEMLQYYGRWGEENGDGVGSGNAEITWRYVYKIDFSLGYKGHGGGGGGNTVATREISSPRIVLTFKHAANDVSHNVHVCYESTTFESTSSATGRVQLSISS